MSIGGLLVVVLFAALIGPYFIDWSSYKQAFEREASRIAGQPVSVGGDASVRLLPLPGVTFADLSVGRYEDGSPMMTVRSFSMNTELMPFLRGEIRIVDMLLDQPEFTVRVNENGTIAWTDRKETVLDPDSVKVESLRIENASLRIDGLAGGRSFSGNGFNADVTGQSLYGPWQIEAAGIVEGSEAQFSVSTGRLSEENSIRIRLQAVRAGLPYRLGLDGPVSVAEDLLTWNGRFTVTALTDLRDNASEPLPIHAEGDFSASPNSIGVSEYRLEIGGREDPYTITGEGDVAIRERVFFRFFADGRQMDLDRFAENSGIAGKGPGLAERLSVLRSIVDRIPVPDAKGEIDFSLPAIVAGDTVVREFKAKVQPDINGWQVNDLSAIFPGNTHFEAEGKLGIRADFGFTGQMLVASRQPTGFANWLSGRTNASLRRLKTAGMSAQVTLTDTQATFDELELILDSARLSGRVQRLSPEGSRPAIIASLAGDRINLDDLVALHSMTLPGDGKAAPGKQDVDLTLRADTLEMADMTANGVDLHATIQEGALSVDRLNADDFYGSSIVSSGRLDNFPSRVEGNFGLKIVAKQAQQLIALAARQVPENPVLSVLASDPSLTEDLEIDLAIDARPTDGGVRGSVVVSGKIGATNVRISDRFEGSVADWISANHDASLSLEQEDAAKLARQLGLPVLPLPASGPVTVNLDASGNEESGFDILMTANAPGTDLSASGNLTLDGIGLGEIISGATGIEAAGFRGDLTFGSQDIDEWLLLAGMALPGTGEGTPASVSAGFTKDGGLYSLQKMEGQIAGVGFSGKLDLDTDRPGRPKVAGQLSLEGLAVREAAEIVLGPGVLAEDIDGGRWPVTEFQEPVFAGLDGEVEIKASEVYFPLAGPGSEATGLDTKLTLIDGSATLSPLKFEWLGAMFDGNASLKNVEGNAVFGTQLMGSDVDAGRLVEQIGFGRGVTGKGKLNLKLDGTGRSMGGIVSNLTGSGIMTLSESRFLGITTGGLGNILRQTDSEDFNIVAETVDPVARNSMLAGSFAVAEFSTPFTVTGGKLAIRNLALSDANGKIEGSVEFSLADLETGLVVTIAPQPGEQELTGAEPEATFTWMGKPGELRVSTDSAALQGYLSLRAYEREQRRVEILQSKALENQRLRREVILTNARINVRERQRFDELKRLEEIQKKLEEERLQREEEEKAEKARQEEETRLRMEETERLRQEEEQRRLEEEALENPENSIVDPAPVEPELTPDAATVEPSVTEPPIEIAPPPPTTTRPPNNRQNPKPRNLFEGLQRLFGN